jgi:serine/threonine-protein kinase
MSPEQASAERDLSARSDVYSLGCVLYEMLAGEPPHTGPNAAAILMRILTEQPRPISDLRPTVPIHVANALARAVEKLPADRFESAKEFRQALEDPSFRFSRTTVAAAVPVASSSRARRWDARSTVLAGTAALFAAIAGWFALRPPAPVQASGEVLSFLIADSVPASLVPIAGPHGWMAWVQENRLYARPPGSLEVTRPVGDQRVDDLVSFSPDGEWIAHLQSSGNSVVLRKTPSRGGNPATLVTMPGQAFSPLWGDDGSIYLMHGNPAEWVVSRVSENGGAIDTLFKAGTSIPYFFTKPAGRSALLMGLLSPTLADPRVVALDLGNGDTSTVISQGLNPQLAPTGHLLFSRSEGSLFAVPFDTRSMQATGSAVPVLDSLAEQFPLARFSLSPEGTLFYVAGRSSGGVAGQIYSLLLMNVAGGRTQIPLPASDHWDAKLAPDGRRLAYIRSDQVWIYDLELGTHTQLTRDGDRHHNPVWSPDGERVAFAAQAEDRSNVDIFVASASGGTSVVRLGGSAANDYPSQWLPDSTILLNTQGPGGEDIYTLREGEDSARAVLHADWNERAPRLSPDGRWLAFMSQETGASHLYVRRWPGLGSKVQVTEGEPMPPSGFPLWSPDGRTLYYHQGEQLIAASVDARGDTLRVTARRVIANGMNGILADIHPDGRRLLFLGLSTSGDTTAALEPRRLVVTTNWLSTLRQRFSDGRP